MTIYLCESIKRLRREKELTQEALADFLGVTFQSVSKWERGESYPDITMLPEIAQFFQVSVDELLGVNKARNEEEILQKIAEFDNLTDEKLMEKLILELKEKYPNDFRVLLRYMGYLIFYRDIRENAQKILSIYKTIQQNCKVDTIRMCAKRYLIYYYEELSKIDGSGISFDDCESIIKEMPRMRDGQECFCFSYPEDHPNRDEKIQEAMEEQFFLFDTTLNHYYFWNDKFSVDYKISILEKILDFFDFLYDDGNYSRFWRTVMYDHGHLGHFYFVKGEKEKALFHLRKSAELAVQFDEMDRVTVLHSTLFSGKEFDKHTLGSNHIAKSRMKYLMTEKYPLSDEFKASDEFRKIIEMLE